MSYFWQQREKNNGFTIPINYTSKCREKYRIEEKKKETIRNIK